MEPRTELQSWRAAVGGSGEAFASLFDLHGDRVYRHARRLTDTVADAEDVTAGAFLELWRKRRAVRVVGGSVLPWLLVTTTNLARNQARGLRRYRAMIAALPRAEAGPSADELVLDKLANETATARVRNALDALKPDDATLIALTTFEQLSTAEVAEALGISAGAARTRLHRAHTRLAGLLDPPDHDRDTTTRVTKGACR